MSKAIAESRRTRGTFSSTCYDQSRQGRLPSGLGLILEPSRDRTVSISSSVGSSQGYEYDDRSRLPDIQEGRVIDTLPPFYHVDFHSDRGSMFCMSDGEPIQLDHPHTMVEATGGSQLSPLEPPPLQLFKREDQVCSSVNPTHHSAWTPARAFQSCPASLRSSPVSATTSTGHVGAQGWNLVFGQQAHSDSGLSIPSTPLQSPYPLEMRNHDLFDRTDPNGYLPNIPNQHFSPSEMRQTLKSSPDTLSPIDLVGNDSYPGRWNVAYESPDKFPVHIHQGSMSFPAPLVPPQTINPLWVSPFSSEWPTPVQTPRIGSPAHHLSAWPTENLSSPAGPMENLSSPAEIKTSPEGPPETRYSLFVDTSGQIPLEQWHQRPHQRA